MIAAYVTREDVEAYGALTWDLPSPRPVADPPRGSVRGTIQLYVDGIAPPGVRETVERMINEFAFHALPVEDDARYRARVRAALGMDASPLWKLPPPPPFRERWEPLLAAILEAAPREARDGFNRRQGKAWDAFLVELAGLREDVAGGWSEPASATEWARVAWHRAVSKGAR